MNIGINALDPEKVAAMIEDKKKREQIAKIETRLEALEELEADMICKSEGREPFAFEVFIFNYLATTIDLSKIELEECS